MSRILIVEDEPAIAELIAINLRHAGFEVTIAGDAEQAQASLDQVLPHLVILDWMLPGLLARVRAIFRHIERRGEASSSEARPPLTEDGPLGVDLDEHCWPCW